MGDPEPIHELSLKRFADDYYGLFKIVEETLCRRYHLGFGVPVTVARFPLIWMPEDLASGKGRIDADRTRITRQLDVTGRPLVRHDAHIDDVVQCVLLTLRKDEAVGDDFTFAAPAAPASDAVAEAIRRHVDLPIEDRATDWHSWQLDCTKARSILGYRPRVDLIDAMERALGAL